MGSSEYVFLSLAVCPSVGQWQPEEDRLLSLKTENFETVGTHWFLPFHQVRGASSKRCSPFNDFPRPSVRSSSLAGWVELCTNPQCYISHFAFGASCNLTTTDRVQLNPHMLRHRRITTKIHCSSSHQRSWCLHQSWWDVIWKESQVFQWGFTAKADLKGPRSPCGLHHSGIEEDWYSRDPTPGCPTNLGRMSNHSSSPELRLSCT